MLVYKLILTDAGVLETLKFDPDEMYKTVDDAVQAIQETVAYYHHCHPAELAPAEIEYDGLIPFVQVGSSSICSISPVVVSQWHERNDS